MQTAGLATHAIRVVEEPGAPLVGAVVELRMATTRTGAAAGEVSGVTATAATGSATTISLPPTR